MEDQEQDKLSRTTLTALCVSLKIQVPGTCSTTLKWPRIRFQRFPLASLPACQPASRASATCRHSLPAGPVRAMAPTCGTNLRFKSPSSRWLRPQFKFQLFKFQVFKFQVVMFSSWQTFKSSQIPHPRLTVWNAPASTPVCKRENLILILCMLAKLGPQDVKRVFN